MNPDKITGKRAQRRKLRSMMDDLSQMSLADGQEKVRAKVKEIEELFVFWDIPEGGALDLKLDEICAKLGGFSPKEKTAESSNEMQDNRVKYIGFSKGKIFRIKRYSNHYFLMRTYSEKGKPVGPEIPYLEVSWEFGETGLLKGITAQYIKPNEVTPYELLRVIGEIARIQGKRAFRAACMDPLPMEMGLLNPGFNELAYPLNFQSLIHFGYGDILQLRRNILANTKYPSKKLTGDKKDLRMILSHPETLRMIDNTIRYMPNVLLTGERGYLNIVY